MISFVINIALLVYFLRPKVLKEEKREKAPKVVGYDDGNGPVRIKDADSYDYRSLFDPNKGWRNLLGFEDDRLHGLAHEKGDQDK